ncbi:MAG TPA: gephyrin-like molybdotransferase Glp [Candidatus Koribacter sp.]|jgi:molybdopterin molybdotransferase
MSQNELPTFAEARALIDDYAVRIAPLPTEIVELSQADHRVLADDLHADRDFPPFPRATRDGFAVRSADVQSIPAKLKVIAEIAAGSAITKPLHAGEAAEIMTGAPLPDGADAVIMVEYSHHETEIVTLERTAHAGDNFVPRGAEAEAGALLISAGTRLNPAAIAIAASVGNAELQVFRRPVIAILSTGDELVELRERPGASQIRNSNSYSLAAQVRRAGGSPRILPIARDRESSIRDGVNAAKSADLLVLSGGVSMGKYDLVEQVLAAEGAQFHMTGARIQPGKPIVFGTLPRAARELPFFGLPGNPISTMVTFDLFVTPVLNALSGAKSSPLRFAHARLGEDLKVSPGLTRFLPAVLTSAVDHATVTPVPWHGSGDLAAIVRANCYLVVPPEATALARDSYVTVLLKD